MGTEPRSTCSTTTAALGASSERRRPAVRPSPPSGGPRGAAARRKVEMGRSVPATLGGRGMAYLGASAAFFSAMVASLITLPAAAGLAGAAA